ncbi:DUF6197 family protein [Streptomyces longwoodensis]|uniref:DUF6197 family protein n=1 Tax=Streptomyces longwoodensis TaxID=68231 RepID=UPI003803B88C
MSKTPTGALTSAKVADALDAAAAHIERVGWFQGDMYDPEQARIKPLTQCAVCALGAINVALHGSPQFPLHDSEEWGSVDAHDLADYVTARRIEGFDLAAWNDEPGRTQDDVTTALRETAAELRRAAAS